MNRRQPFEAHAVKGGELWTTEDELPAMQALGLHLQNRWQDYLRAGLAGGRGRVAVVETRTRRLLLKQLRRGGALRSLWRDRFAGNRRLLANLTLPFEAIDRGVSTPPAVAMLLVPGPPDSGVAGSRSSSSSRRATSAPFSLKESCRRRTGWRR